MRTALATAALLLLSAPASAQNASWAQKIFYGVDSHDFGTCPRGAKLKHRFRIKNIYAVPLQITNVRTSCGCLTWKVGKNDLKPQEESYIDVIMDASKFKGPKSLTLYVTVGPTYISTAAIRISAVSRQDVVFNPGAINFGVIPTGQQLTQSVDVEYAGSLDWRIIEVVKSKDAPFDVSVQPWYRNSARLFRTGKVGYKLHVTIKQNATSGTFQQKLLLKTNDPSSPVLPICVEGTVQAALTARPSTVNLGTVKAGQSFKQRVIVRGARPFRIVGVAGTGKGVNAAAPNQASALHIVTITCTPDAAGAMNRQLRFQTDMGGASVTVDIRADVQK